MAIIGTFQKQDDGGFAGQVRTLTLSLEQVSFRPVETGADRSPDFRIFSGEVEAGAAWRRTSREGREYLSVKLDDPGFATPAYATLIEGDAGWSLVWSRGRIAD